VVSGVLDAVKGFLEGTASLVGLSGVSHLLMGSGKVDVPEVWTGASATKNYSFNLALRSPYGDPISIYQSIYVPLSMILAASLPRAVGPNAYTTPFLVRAYSKGMLAVPLGIIDSLTIKRGADQHGWNYQRLPTVVDVSFTIKDLSPAMYMAIGDDSILDAVMGENSSFQDYLLTLSGIGLQERLRWLKNIRRRSEALLKTVYANRVSPIAWGLNITHLGPMRLIKAVAPSTKLPTN
jgi:hypothetical protein